MIHFRPDPEVISDGLIGGPISRCLTTSFTAADLKDCG
jgi:hypothetical protein